MKIVLATLYTLALQFLLALLMVLVVAAVLVILVPATLPAIGFTWFNALGLSGLLFLAKALFK